MRSTEESILNLFVSDGSDTHAFIYRADGEFQLVRKFEFWKKESSACWGCRELLAVHKMLESEPECFSMLKGTVSRDFLLQVFFMNHLTPSP